MSHRCSPSRVATELAPHLLKHFVTLRAVKWSRPIWTASNARLTSPSSRSVQPFWHGSNAMIFNAFQWLCPHGFLGPKIDPPPKRRSRSARLFLQDSRTWPTDTHLRKPSARITGRRGDSPTAFSPRHCSYSWHPRGDSFCPWHCICTRIADK